MFWLAEGIALSQRVLVVALAVVLPMLVGFAIDRWTEARFPVGILLGCLFGMLSGGWQLWSLLRWLEKRPQTRRRPDPSRPPTPDDAANQGAESDDLG
jgi:hypothetical protein